MKSLYSSAVLVAIGVLALFATTVPVHSAPLVRSQTKPSATQRKVSTLQINNKNGLVTVQDKDGAYLFANAITTKNLKISLAKPKNALNVLVVLSDEKNKKIWETSMGDGGHSKFAFNFNWTKNEDNTVETKGVILSLTPEETVASNEIISAVKGSIVLAGDGCPNAMNIDSGDNQIVLTRSGNKFTLTNYENGKEQGSQVLSADTDKSTVDLAADGKTVHIKGSGNGATVNTGPATFNIGTVVKDGKTYVFLDLGNRRILLPAGKYKFDTDGDDIIVTPDTDSK